MMTRNLLVFCGCWMLFASSAWSAEFYVAPGGNDSNPGTKDRPVATLVRARDLVKQLKSQAEEPIQVVLRGGTYAVDEPLLLGPDDSGTPPSPDRLSVSAGRKSGAQRRKGHHGLAARAGFAVDGRDPRSQAGQVVFPPTARRRAASPAGPLAATGIPQGGRPGRAPQASLQVRRGPDRSGVAEPQRRGNRRFAVLERRPHADRIDRSRRLHRPLYRRRLPAYGLVDRLVRGKRGRRAHPARPVVSGSRHRRPLLLAAAGRADGQGAGRCPGRQAVAAARRRFSRRKVRRARDISRAGV